MKDEVQEGEGGRVEEECEVEVISLADAVADERTMMVEYVHAVIADATVTRSRRPEYAARLAVRSMAVV